MSHHANGLKAVLVGLLLSITVALSGWALVTTVAHGERITRTETRSEALSAQLDRIERKLDVVLRRGWTP